VLYVSHAPEEVARLADHLVLLEGGRALASGPIADTLARLDLPLAIADDASVVFEGIVGGYDSAYGLLTLTLPGSGAKLAVVHAPMAEGRTMRVAVKARDVSLLTGTHEHERSSVLNVLPATVVGIAQDANPSQAVVRLDVDGSPLLARVTRYSLDRLGIVEGTRLWAQVKAVSLLA
jgi:molybdate transport system ATP-binding protein